MSKEALRLAVHYASVGHDSTAAELRRLAASEQRLVGALELVRMSRGWQYMADETRDVIDAAIAAAKEQQ